MAKNQWIIEDAPQKALSPQGIGQQLARVGTATGLSALQGGENLASLIPGQQLSNTLRERFFGLPKEENLTDVIKNQFDLTPEYLEPRNVLENYLQRFAEYAPASLATGGLSGLGRTAIGTGVGSALSQLGLPESVQDIGQIATEVGLGVRAGKLPTIREAQQKAYTNAKSTLNDTVQSNAKPIIDSLSNIESKLGTEVSEKYSSKIKHALQTVEQNISKNKINPKKAMELRRSLYKLRDELPYDTNGTYIKPLTDSINDFFALYSAENPQFYKHLKNADKLTELKHLNLVLPKFVNILELNKAPLGKAITLGVNSILGEGERFIKSIAKNPAARQYYFNAVSSLAGSNPNLFLKNFNKMRELLPELNASTPKPQNLWIIEP